MIDQDRLLCYSPHVNDIMDITEYKKLLPERPEIIDRLVSVLFRLQNLELTQEEQGLVAAISVMNARK